MGRSVSTGDLLSGGLEHGVAQAPSSLFGTRPAATSRVSAWTVEPWDARTALPGPDRDGGWHVVPGFRGLLREAVS